MRLRHGAILLLGLLSAAFVSAGCDNAFKTITIKIGYKTAETGKDSLTIQIPAGDLSRLDGDVDFDGFEGDFEMAEVDVGGEVALDIPACQEDAARLCVDTLPYKFQVELSKSSDGKGVNLSKYKKMVKGIYISSLAYSVLQAQSTEFALTGILPPLRIFLSPQLQTPSGQDNPILYHDWASETPQNIAAWNLCSTSWNLPADLKLVHLGDTGQILNSLDLPDLGENFPTSEHFVDRDLLNAEEVSEVLQSNDFSFELVAVPCGKAQLLPEDQRHLKEQLPKFGGANPQLRLQLHMNVVLATQL